MRALRQHPELYVSTETHYFDDLRRRMKGKHQSPLSSEDQQLCEDYFLSIAHKGYGRSGDPSKSPMSRAQLRSTAAAFGSGSDAYFAAFCRLQASEHAKTRWGEKTPRHVFRIDDMLHRFPHAKILCLVRDPRAVIASYRDMASPSEDGGIESGRTPQQQLRKQRSYDLLVMSLLWRSTVNHAVAAINRHGPDRVRLLRYEDLVRDPMFALRGVTNWLGLEFFDAMLQVDVRNSTYAPSGSSSGISLESVERWRKRLTQEEVVTIQVVCQRWMQEFGYTLEPTSFAPFYVAASWIRLPFSALRATFANRARSGPMLPYVWRRMKGTIAGPPS